MFTRFWWRNLRKRECLEDPDIDWEDNFMMDLQEVGWGGKDWLDLGQDRDRWQELVNALMNLLVP